MHLLPLTAVHHRGWGYQQYSESMQNLHKGKEKGKNKTHCNCHSGWDKKSSRESIKGKSFRKEI